MNQRLTIFLISFLVAVFVGWVFAQFELAAVSSYATYTVLAIVLFAILVSNQQYEEDVFSMTERNASSFLLSYIIFFKFMYLPLRQFFFGTLVTTQSFFSELLGLMLFGICFVLFIVMFLVTSRSARFGLFPSWTFLNNEAIFITTRFLFLPAVAIAIILEAKNYF